MQQTLEQVVLLERPEFPAFKYKVIANEMLDVRNDRKSNLQRRVLTTVIDHELEQRHPIH